MTFERLHHPLVPRGVLNDVELKHLLSLAQNDPAILEACGQLALQVRADRTSEPRVYNDELIEDLEQKVTQEIRRLTLSVFPNATRDDWFEIELHMGRYLVKRWLSDLPSR